MQTLWFRFFQDRPKAEELSPVICNHAPAGVDSQISREVAEQLLNRDSGSVSRTYQCNLGRTHFEGCGVSGAI